MNGMEIPKSGLRTNKKPILYTNEGNYKYKSNCCNYKPLEWACQSLMDSRNRSLQIVSLLKHKNTVSFNW